MTNRGKVLIFCAVGAWVVGILLVALKLGIDPAWSLIVAPLLPIAVVLIRRYPALLIAAMLFVGNYKTHAAVGISLTDPTLITVGLLAATTTWEVLLIVGGVSEKTLGELFRGQKWSVVAFLLLQLTMTISFLYTSSPQAATEKLEHIIVFNTLAFFTPFFLFKRERAFQMLLWAVVLLAIPIAIRLIVGISHPNDKQVFGEADVTYIGDAELLGITVLILLYHRRSGRFGRLMTFVALPILSVGMVASVARGPSLVLLLVVVLTTILLPRAGPQVVSRRVLVAGVLLLIVGMGAALSWLQQLPGAELKSRQKGMELTALMHGTLDAGGTTSKRLDFFKSSALAFSENPFAGLGLAGWGNFYYGDNRSAFPHCFVLEVAAEQGLPGLVALLGLLGAGFISLARIRRARSEFIFVLPVFLFTILTNMITGGIDDRIMFFWIAAVFVVDRMVIEKPREHYAGLATPSDYLWSSKTLSTPYSV
jgi:O-antigen ligase